MQTTPSKVKVSNLQYSMMVIAATAAFGHFVYAHLAIMYGGRDTWVSLIIGAVLGTGTRYLLLKQAARTPELSLVQRLTHAFGKWIGIAVSILYILFFLAICAITLRVVVDFMNIIYPSSPSGVFILAILLIAGWVSYKGMEVLARSIQFILPILMLLGIVASLLSMPDKNYRELLPILDSGWRPVWDGALVFIAMFSEFIVFESFTNSANNPTLLPKHEVVTLIILFFMFLGPVTGPIALFGVPLAKSLAFPTYTEIQYIHVGNIIERFDIVGVLLWTNGSFFRVSTYLLAASKGVAELLHVEENTFVIPVSLFAAALTLGMTEFSREEVFVFLRTTYIYAAISIGIGLPLLVGLVSWIRKPSSRDPSQKAA